MISKKFKSYELVGRKCKPVRQIKNGCGEVISPETICTIKDASYGIDIQTNKCPHCGQSAYITRLHREDLTLIEDEQNRGKA